MTADFPRNKRALYLGIVCFALEKSTLLVLLICTVKTLLGGSAQASFMLLHMHILLSCALGSIYSLFSRFYLAELKQASSLSCFKQTI